MAEEPEDPLVLHNLVLSLFCVRAGKMLKCAGQGLQNQDWEPPVA